MLLKGRKIGSYSNLFSFPFSTLCWVPTAELGVEKNMRYNGRYGRVDNPREV
jgi:hypothetical protein